MRCTRRRLHFVGMRDVSAFWDMPGSTHLLLPYIHGFQDFLGWGRQQGSSPDVGKSCAHSSVAYDYFDKGILKYLTYLGR